MQIYQAQTLTFSLANGVSGSVPAGASITPAGVFTWTPTTAGSFTFDVVVSDGNGGTDSETITVTVTAANVAPVLGAIGAKSIIAGQQLTFTATATDANIPAQPLTFSLNGAPTGASITLAGVFTWTPATAGSYTFDVRVSDGNGGTDSETITVTVTSTSPNVIPVVNAGPDKNVTKGLPFVSSGSFTDPDADTWTATVNYGDSTGTTNLALYTNKTFAFIHTYTAPGSLLLESMSRIIKVEKALISPMSRSMRMHLMDFINRLIWELRIVLMPERPSQRNGTYRM